MVRTPHCRNTATSPVFTPTEPLAEERPPPEVARYVGEWALFADWCAATGRVALPADPVTVEAFLRACPAAPATMARRLSGIGHHHTAAGLSPPARTDHIRDLARGRPARLVRQSLDQAGVDAALRALRIVGWTAGWFGRRDRALLVLAAADIPYRRIAQLTVAHLELTDRAVTITAAGGDGPVVIAAGDDPVDCRACALGRWVRILNLDATTNTRTVREALQGQKRRPAVPHHICRQPEPVDPRAAGLPLLPPIDPHGSTHLDQPVSLTRQSVSQLARDTTAGRYAGHQILPLPLDPDQNQQAAITTAPAAYTAQQYQRGLEQRAADRDRLDELVGTLNDIDARIAALEARTRTLVICQADQR